LKNLLVGIDVGTTGLKVAFYSAGGVLVDRAYREYSLSFPQKGWVEINPEVWWEQLRDCMEEIFSRGQINLSEIAGIGITCTNSLVVLDAQRNTLMPAIMQLDQRAVPQAEKLKEKYGQDWVFQKTGNRISSGANWGPALQWTRENKVSVYEQAKYLLVPTSYLILRLTGVYSIDHSRATTTMLYNIRQRDWDPELCEAFGLSGSILPQIYKSHEIVGVVDEAGERGIGFLAGTPVIAGAMDSIGALIGLGAGSETGALVMGSVGRICIESSHLDKRFMNTVNYDATNSLIITPVNNAGISYKWAKNLFFDDSSGYSNIYQTMDQMADTVSPGSEGLLYIPYLTGERSPIWDSRATGSFMGMTIKHTREHFIRAVLEGVGLAIAHNFEILQHELNLDPPFLIAGGGGSSSRIWIQIVSDMLGKPLHITEQLETETMGAAMLAGIGIGLFSDLSVMQKSWIRVSEKVVPRMEVHEMYKDLLVLYKELSVKNQLGV
jgi:xylulokinase